MKKHFIPLFLFFMITSIHLSAQSKEEIGTVTNNYVLQNVNIISQPGSMIKMGTIVIKNGIISEIGKNVPIPADAKVLKADSMFVYAGFIEGASHTGVPKTKDESGQSNNNNNIDKGNPPNKIAGITPELEVRDVLDPKDKSIATMRKLGFTAAHIVPQGRMLPGSGAVILLHGENKDDMILKEELSLFSQLLASSNRVSPATILGVISKWKELYIQAKNAKQNDRKYQNNPTGIKHPTRNKTLEAFYPVIDRSKSVYFKAEDIRSIYRVLNLQKELGFPLVLTDVQQGWHVTDQIKAQNIPIFLSLDLPKDKDKDKKKKEGDKKEKDTDKEKEKSKDEKKAKDKKEKLTKAQIAFNKKRKAALQQYNRNATTMQEKGIAFGFSTLGVKAKDIRANLRTMIQNGLKEETAIAALTTIPAKQLGVSKIMGTLEKGKIANLVVTDKAYFDEKSNIRIVMVDGHPYEFKIKEKKKGDPNAKVKIAGAWNISIALPGETNEGLLTIEENDGEYTGLLAENEEDDEPTKLENIELKGNELSFTSEVDNGGQMLSLSFDLVMDGNTLEGTVSVGDFGTFDVEGDRDPK